MSPAEPPPILDAPTLKVAGLAGTSTVRPTCAGRLDVRPTKPCSIQGRRVRYVGDASTAGRPVTLPDIARCVLDRPLAATPPRLQRVASQAVGDGPLRARVVHSLLIGVASDPGS